ncbi:cell wall-active antibiotics response protein LiaF [Paenibacillus albus]|uniref:cell wall-active antibiotics response protein LiaF n=1 Tax=Paenibacillus albus TaxID=2495582 RepID=UPI001D130FB2|nr:cell wall-active antibiotics response protein LiaF [Paenibacillus albus]
MHNFITRLFWGLFIIVVGVGLMLRQAGVIDFDIGMVAATYWPALLLVLGVLNVLSKSSFFGSAVLIIVGVLFLGRNLDWFDWSVHDLLQFGGPLILILIGLRVIFKPKKKPIVDQVAPEEEWKAYNYSQSEAPVPPAPPLHPDPTKPMDPEEAGAIPQVPPMPSNPYGPSEAPSENMGYEAVKPPVEPGYGYGPVFDKMDKHQRKLTRHQAQVQRWHDRAEKMRARMEQNEYHRMKHRHHHRNERVEWWNHNPGVQTRSGFIGDIYLGQDYWELKPMNISHFIGDTVLDLTKAQIPPGETIVNISSFIGDVKVYLPNDYEIGVHVVSSAFVGDVAVLEHREGGIFKNMDIQTPYFPDTDKK